MLSSAIFQPNHISSIATIDVPLLKCFIRVKCGDITYKASNLLSKLETHLPEQSIKFYREPVEEKSAYKFDSDFCICYHESKLIITKSKIDEKNIF